MAQAKGLKPREIAAQLVSLGAAFACGRGLSRSEGIAAIVEAVAELGVDVFRGDDGQVYLSLSNTAKHENRQPKTANL